MNYQIVFLDNIDVYFDGRPYIHAAVKGFFKSTITFTLEGKEILKINKGKFGFKNRLKIVSQNIGEHPVEIYTQSAASYLRYGEDVFCYTTNLLKRDKASQLFKNNIPVGYISNEKFFSAGEHKYFVEVESSDVQTNLLLLLLFTSTRYHIY